MTNRDFETWCKAATAKIRYGPDRESVSTELRAHLEDKYDSLIAKGISPGEATAMTLESMGSPAEIASQLGKIHRPWLGYLYSIVKCLGISTAAVAACLLCLMLYASLGQFIQAYTGPYLPRMVEDLTYHCEPGISAHAEGYHILVDEAAVGEYEGEITGFIRLEISWLPWMKEPSFLNDLWAVDNLGNYYYPYGLYAYAYPRIAVGGGYSTRGSCAFTMMLRHFDPEAQWVELCYNRDGRNLVFRIDLAGGDTE